MKTVKTATVVGSALLWAMTAPVAVAEKPLIVSGVGITTCAKFAEEYRRNPDYTQTIYTTWAQGFIAGHNYSTYYPGLSPLPSSFRDVKAQSLDTMQGHIRHYCDRHPLAQFIEAVTDFMQTMPIVNRN